MFAKSRVDCNNYAKSHTEFSIGIIAVHQFNSAAIESDITERRVRNLVAGNNQYFRIGSDELHVYGCGDRMRQFADTCPDCNHNATDYT